MTARPRLAVIGSTDLARLLAHHALASGCEIAGFFDNRRVAGERVGGYGAVLGSADDIVPLHAQGRFDALMLGVGYLQAEYRRDAFLRFKGQIPFHNLIHPSASVSPDCVLGEGVVILPGCVLDTEVTLGDNVLLNTGVIIAHHSAVGDHSFIGPAAAIAGKVHIGQSCFVGINSTIIDHRRIGDHVTIAAGALVVDDLAEQGLYLGSPAKRRLTGHDTVS